MTVAELIKALQHKFNPSLPVVADADGDFVDVLGVDADTLLGMGSEKNEDVVVIHLGSSHG